ncbi:N-acetylmuramoyl-L-alanine amidase [Caloramator proteoclasticus]|uniref:N-acetylmuramoyl-L-alanine amidase n=1 Tax=Caloramator proteoclasticus DSM 10124 TaxID=1121262 RepID=A0A1M4ZE20_9CLOT|nr:N-acetylmuramoyl-L-alanine amidase [Caloramator proteoclasticus]SHF16057.1 N-acetylmuramoyl-L-alanine amidase [Caloramator proteoclasticus DSM 10124]
MARVCLDYGHGGQDAGAVYKGRNEKDDNLKLGKKVAEILRQNGIVVDETRTGDNTVSLQERSNFERKNNYDYFISFHRNASVPEKAKGVETFVYSLTNVRAKALADKVQANLVALGFVDRKVKSANYHVLRETKAQAILIEVGFIDNTEDNNLFDTKFNDIAKAIAKAILNQLGIEYKEQMQEQSTTSSQVLYRVMAGSFSSRENAEKQVKKLNKLGIDATIMVFDK